MELQVKGDLEYCKSLWTLVSGTYVLASDEVIIEELNRARTQLLHGLNHFRLPNTTSSNELQRKVSRPIFEFVQKLTKFLGLDAMQVWDLLCSYLVYEFRGSEDGLNELIHNDFKVKMLMHDIWLFYRSERMFLLKCVNIVWAYCTDEDHPNHKHYENFILKFNLTQTFSSFLAQFESVTNENVPTAASHGELMTERYQRVWLVTNLREQIELIQNFVLFMDFYKCSAADMQKLLQICKRHSFGQQQQATSLLNKSHEHLLEMIGFMETILLLRALDLEELETGTSKIHTHGALACMEEEVQSLGSSPEHGPILLSWMLISYSAPDTDEAAGLYTKFGELAIRLNVFSYFEKLLKSPLFKFSTKLAKIAYKCIYQLLSLLADWFEASKVVRLPGVDGLLPAVLSEPSVVPAFWLGSADGIRALVGEAKDAFPHRLQPLIGIVEALASCGPKSIDLLMSDLLHLPSYSEDLDPMRVSSNMAEDSPRTFRLTNPYQPMLTLPFEFPTGTVVRIRDGKVPTFQFACEVNFFHVVHHALNVLLLQSSRGFNYVQPETLDKVAAAAKCCAKLLDANCQITPEVAVCIDVIFELIRKFAAASDPPSALLAAFLEVAVALMTNFPDKVCKRLKKIDFLPTVDLGRCVNPDRLARGDFFRLNVVGTLMASQECIAGRYPLIIAYLKFVNKLLLAYEIPSLADVAKENVDLLLPGLILNARSIFPNYTLWRYEDEEDRDTIAYQCVQMFHKILSLESTSPRLKTEEDGMEPTDLLRAVCLCSLLNTETGLSLLKIVAVGDQFIQTYMERHISWVVGRGKRFILVVQLAMSVLNRVLLLKSVVHQGAALCYLESLIYRQPNHKGGLRVVLVVANYIYHCFNPQLPILALKLLKRFAMEFPMSLLACLGADGTVICRTYKSRLSSSTESTAFKVAVLEFVTACVERQPGLTEAFFYLHEPSKKTLSEKHDERGGCLVFICCVLRKLLTTPEDVPISLHQACVELLHAIWMGRKQTVMAYLRETDKFWDGLCKPLFMEPCASEVPVYCQIFSIVNLELYNYKGQVDKQLESSLCSLFKSSETTLFTWSKFVSSSLADKTSEGRCIQRSVNLLKAWKEFLTVVAKKFNVELSGEQKQELCGHVMEALLRELTSIDDVKVLVLLTDLYLILVNNWKSDCFKDTKVVLHQLSEMMYLVQGAYQSLPLRANESFHAIAIRIVHLLANEIRADEALGDSLMSSCCNIVSLELNALYEGTTKKPPPLDEVDASDGPKSREPITGALSICLLQKLLCTVVGTSGWASNFHKTKMCNQLLYATKYALRVPLHFEVATAAMNTLLLVSFTEFSKTLILFDVAHELWLELIPPKALNPPKNFMTEDKPWYESNWVRIYIPALKLVTSLLVTHRQVFVEEAISFVGIHEEFIIDSICGVRKCLEPLMLDLAVSTMCLLRILSEFNDTWRTSHEKSFYSVNKSVMSALDTCIAYLIHPPSISAVVERPVHIYGGSVEKGIAGKPDVYGTPGMSRTTRQMPFGRVPNDTDSSIAADVQATPKMVQAQKRLLDYACLCMIVLHPLTPSFISLVTDVREGTVSYQPLVEVSFLSPSIKDYTTGKLTFGSLIALVNMCAQAVFQQMHRCPSPNRSPGRSPTRTPPTKVFWLAEEWLSSLEKAQVTLALELSLSLVTAQGLVFLTDHRLSSQEKKLIRRELSSEMGLFLEYVKRNLREDLDGTSRGKETSSLKRPSNTGLDKVCRRLDLSTDLLSKSRAESPPFNPASSNWVTSTPISHSPLASPRTKKMTIHTVEECTQEFTSEDFFKLIAHIFRCIFR